MKGLFQAPQEMVHSYIKSLGYTSNDFSNDFRNWIKGLTSLPTGSNGDMLSQYLASLGYTGSLADKITRWLEVSTVSVGRPQTDINYFSGVLSQLIGLGGLTFYKNYQGATTLDADYSVGSPTATFTSSRSASNPATYIDANGVVQLVTSANVGRYNSKLYDTTGLLSAKRGLIIEAEGKNLLTRTDGTAASGGLWTGWTAGGTITGTLIKSNVAIPELTSIAGAVSQRVQYTGVAGDAPDKNITITGTDTANDSFVQNDTVTFSAYIRSLTGNSGAVIRLYVSWRSSAPAEVEPDLSSDLASSITSEWKKFTFTTQGVHADINRIGVRFFVTGVGSGDTVDLEVALPQLEKNPYATTFVPTTTAALTRPAEVLKYETAGNRTAAAETIFVKFIPIGTFANDGITRTFLDSDDARRYIAKNSGDSKVWVYSNVTDSAGSLQVGATVPSSNTSYVHSSVIKHSNPFISGYLNGASDGSPETADDFTDPAWGTYFRVGNNILSSSQLGGIIQSVCFYNRALSAAEVAAVSTLLQNSN